MVQAQQTWSHGRIGLLRTMQIEEARNNICRMVKYREEYGIITSVNSTYVFVKYANDNNSKATAPQDLTLC